MTHETAKTKEIISTVGALGGAVLIAVAMAEARALVKDRRNGSHKADVVSNIRPGEHATFTVPGYHADGRTLGKNLDRHFEQMGTTHFAIHPERGFSLDSIRDEWLKARDRDGHRPARIYALSMGGLLVARMFSDPEFRQEFGEVDKVVLDSALSGKEDLDIGTKLSMLFAAVLPVTHLTGQLYRVLSSGQLDKEIDHAPEVLREEAIERLRVSADTRFSAGKGQIDFMRSNDVNAMDLREFGQEVKDGFIYLASTCDKVVNTRRSAGIYGESLEQDIAYRIDTLRRDSTSHAGGPERPQGPIDALLDQNSSRYRTSTVRYMLNRMSQKDEAGPEWAPAA